MNYWVKLLSPEQWQDFSEAAHKLAFGTIKPKEWDRIDYALMAMWNEDMIGYVTVRELDPHTVYWQFGGGLPSGAKTIKILPGYLEMLEWTKERYKQMVTFIENHNIPMLKLAMKAGLRITGIRYFEGSVLLEHSIKF